MNNGKKPVLLAVFLLLTLVFLGSWPFSGKTTYRQGIWGGPAFAKEDLSASPYIVTAALYAHPAVVGSAGQSDDFLSRFKTLEFLGLVQGNASSFGMSGGRGLPIKYNVAKGDNLSTIAKRFGVSVQTLISANPGVKTSSLRIGQELIILQTSGVLYQSREGDTLQTIAAAFKVAPDQIIEFNRPVLALASSQSSAEIGQGEILPGTTLIIPGAYVTDLRDFSQNKSVSGYFIKPVDGWSSGILHYRNALDIANACGTPVAAAAEGLVLDVAASGWNGGYGSYVYMEHPNGTKTKYAHLEKVSVEIGDYLKQGDKIGTIGRTGEATGCHLHFEVDGAANPFARP